MTKRAPGEIISASRSTQKPPVIGCGIVLSQTSIFTSRSTTRQWLKLPIDQGIYITVCVLGFITLDLAVRFFIVLTTGTYDE